MTATSDLSSLGFRINLNGPRASKELIDAFAAIRTTDIADVVGKLYSVDTVIKPLYTPCRRTAGSAFTVRVPPGDNLMVHAAVDYAQDGDILVVDARGDTEYSLGGALLCGIAKRHGVRGFVLDGVYRDGGEMQEYDFPVFGRGLQPKPGKKLGPGEIGTVVNLGGVPVHPGDIVVADAEGVVVVPLEYAEAVLAKAQERVAWDAAKADDIAGWDREHKELFEKKLRELGVRIDG